MDSKFIEKILDDLAVEYHETNTDFVMSCPFHVSDSHSTTLNLSKDKGVFNCFSCHEGGGMAKLVMGIADISYADTLQYLNSFSSTFITTNRTSSFKELFKKVNRKVESKKILESKDIPLPKTMPLTSHPYLLSRGLTEQEILYHDMRMVTDREFKGWILIPVYRDGILRTYFLRDTKSSSKIYAYYTEEDEDGNTKNIGYPRADILYGMDLCRNYDEPLVVAEGIFDSIFNKRIIPQSVALLSNRVLKEQEEFLLKFKKIIIVPDNDENHAGLHLVKDILRLGSKIDIRVAQLPSGKKDSAVCSKMELTAAIHRATSIYDFIVSDRYLRFNLFLTQIKNTTKKKYK